MGLFSFFRRRDRSSGQSAKAGHEETDAGERSDEFAIDPADRPHDGSQYEPPAAGGDSASVLGDLVAPARSRAAEDTTELESMPQVPQISSGTVGNVRWAAKSITGNFRENNEDSLAADEQGRHFIVADGMGGQMAGEKASAMAVEIVGARLAAEVEPEGGPDAAAEVLRAAIVKANTEIMVLGNVDPAYGGMGTTIVSLVRAGQTWVVGSVGDSRVYRLHGETLEQVTKDHSLTQALIDAGTITPEEAREHRYRNMLVKYLGAKEGSEGGDSQQVPVEAGDRLLLCSDGVTDGADDATIAKILPHGEPAETVAALIKAAEQGGSRDNISAIVVEVLPD